MPDPMRFSPERLFADVTAYAGFGDHQTGSPADAMTAAWIGERLASAGFTVSNQIVDSAFFDADIARLTVDGAAVDGLPLHPVTTADKLSAPLALWRESGEQSSMKGAIAVIVLPYARHSALASPVIASRLADAVKRAPAAIILVTDGPTGEAIALNAADASLFGQRPGLVLGSRDAAPIVRAAASGRQGLLDLRGKGGRRPARNTIGRRDGHGKSLVVTTPLSGWFRCAGERGTGVAAFLALAETLPKRLPQTAMVFAGLVGHERENVGGRIFVAEAAPMPSETALWVHIGSGFATRDWHETAAGLRPLSTADAQRYLIASPDLVPGLKAAMTGQPGFEQTYVADPATAAGESQHILAAGYHRFIGNFGGHRFHHTRSDGPETTTGELIAASASALGSVVLASMSTSDG